MVKVIKADRERLFKKIRKLDAMLRILEEGQPAELEQIKVEVSPVSTCRRPLALHHARTDPCHTQNQN